MKDSIKVNFTQSTRGLSLSRPLFHIANAKHAGYMGAFEGKYNPFSKGTELWHAWNAGRKEACKPSPVILDIDVMWPASTDKSGEISDDR